MVPWFWQRSDEPPSSPVSWSVRLKPHLDSESILVTLLSINNFQGWNSLAEVQYDRGPSMKVLIFFPSQYWGMELFPWNHHCWWLIHHALNPLGSPTSSAGENTPKLTGLWTPKMVGSFNTSRKNSQSKPLKFAWFNMSASSQASKIMI